MGVEFKADRYGLFKYGPEADLPDPDSVPDVCVYVCTDSPEGNFYKVYFKPGRGQGWIRLLGYHTHVFADIEGYLASGTLGFSSAPYGKVPSGNQLLWRYHVPDGLSIPGTEIRADKFYVWITGQKPSNPITFTLKRNDEVLAEATVPAGEDHASVSFDPVTIVPGTDYFEVWGPENSWGATGLDIKIRWSRVRSG